MSFEQTLRDADELFYSTFPHAKPDLNYYEQHNYYYYPPQTYYLPPPEPAQSPTPTLAPKPEPTVTVDQQRSRPARIHSERAASQYQTGGAVAIRPAAMRLSPLPSMRQLERKPPLACLFCRGRKIACGPPVPGSTDKTCNQCQKRSLPCEYPSESRRGMRKKKTADFTDSAKSPNDDKSTSVTTSPLASDNQKETA